MVTLYAMKEFFVNLSDSFEILRTFVPTVLAVCAFSPSELQEWAKEWSLGCVKRALVARGGQDARITQPSDHSLADP